MQALVDSIVFRIHEYITLKYSVMTVFNTFKTYSALLLFTLDLLLR